MTMSGICLDVDTSKPFFVDRFAFHSVEPGIELCFELVPFRTVGILGAPGEAIEFIDVEMCEDNFEWHIVDDTHTKFRWRECERGGDNV